MCGSGGLAEHLPPILLQVVFAFACNAIGVTQIVFSASWTVAVPPVRAGVVVDAFEGELPALGLQEATFIATSFAIAAANSSAGWTEGLSFPTAVPGYTHTHTHTFSLV